MSRRSLFFTTLVGIVLVGLVGLTAGATTYGLFSDSATGSGSIQAADTFNRNPGQIGPPGKKAFDDANGNGRYDDGESRINKNKLSNFDDPNAELVVPSDLEQIEPKGNRDLSVTAASITASTGFYTDDASGVTLTAVDGGISITGQAITSETSDVSIEATGDVDLRQTTVTASNDDIIIETDGVLDIRGATIETSGNGNIELRARQIVADSASIQPQNGGTTVSATRNGGGTLDVTGADLRGGNAGITFESVGSMWLNDSTLTSQNGEATAHLGDPDSTLFVDGTAIDDADGVLVYDPDGVTLVSPRGDIASQ